jgi:hypothetical protein
MTEHAPQPTHAMDADRAALDAAERRIMELEMQLLHSRDFAIGAIAEAGEARAVIAGRDAIIAALDRRAADAETHAANHAAHIARLEEVMREHHRMLRQADARAREADAMRASATWRIGRIVMLPVRVLRRLAR